MSLPSPAMTSAEIRRQFIDFFVKNHAHTFLSSSPVVPLDDPTLLFANAGMNQFKPYFLGTAKPTWTRVTDTQKCIRAGGKHNDLDDVGRSRRHHTFFEMLGNWSFGDYFKQGAIEMAWELLTRVWKIDPTRLHVTCYEGDEKHGIPRDTDAADIWRKVANWEQYGRRSDDHIHYFGKDNFWEMGETGPCGPCTEIHIDRTETKTGGSLVNGTDPRVMEIWNLVFIQYNRDNAGHLTTLPAQHVDTGMGLERICQVLQEKDDNYGTDLFTPLFDAIARASGMKYTGQFPPTNAADPALESANPQLRIDIAFRVIADHLRCLTFALTDGAVPSNEGRGYVLRRILRRAVRFGRQQLNLHEPFLHNLVPVVVDTMGEMFPELKKNPAHVQALIKDEEVSFLRTLDRGIELFEEEFRTAALAAINAGGRFECSIVESNVELLCTETRMCTEIPLSDLPSFFEPPYVKRAPVFPAEAAFRLYDTYGFPIDLTRIMAEERGMTVDLAGYERLMEEAREKARAAQKGAGDAVYDLPPNVLDELAKLGVQPTDDSLKFKHAPTRATVRAIWTGAKLEQTIDAADTRPGQHLALILDRTNFYAEMGGQIGDAGELRDDNGSIFNVDTTRMVGHYVLHIGHIKKGKIRVTDGLTATVLGGRERTMKNHTATHLANWALRETLGDQVQQKGSLVDPDKLRFDFVHQKAMADEEIAKVEQMVNAEIGAKMPVYAEVVPQEKAMKINGLRAVFGEKYPPMVRVVSVGMSVGDLLKNPDNPEWKKYPIEFCGGTHLSNSAEAEKFVITSEESVSKGIRRIVALTGPAAVEAERHAKLIDRLVREASGIADAVLPTHIASLQKAIAEVHTPLLTKRAAQAAIGALQERYKKWQKSEAAGATGGPATTAGIDLEGLLTKAESVNGIALIVATVPDANADTLRNTWDWLKKKHPQQNIAVLLASEFIDTDKEGNKLPPKVNLLAAVGDPFIGKLKAGDWIKAVAPVVGGSGGGRPQLAMAGGKDLAKIPAALDAARAFARQKLG
jgi:alanyl-tRNA synthetase